MPTIDILLAGMNVNTDQSNLGLATIALIRGRNNILVDVAHCGRRRLLSSALASRGLTAEDIHMVVLTHAHWDHAQNVDMFPGARFLIHPAELEYSLSPRKGDWATPRYFAATLQGLNVQPVVEGAELEPGVKIIETPGHTRGHISVAVDTPDGVAIIAGDSFPDAGAVHRGSPYLIFWSKRDAEASVRKIMRLSNVIYPGHDRPFRITSGGSTTYMEGVTAIKVMAGFEEEDMGVGVTIALEAIKQPFVHPEA
ncbi:MAG: MBL fold metallo-hydrolase [Chloroflexota bacterium]